MPPAPLPDVGEASRVGQYGLVKGVQLSDLLLVLQTHLMPVRRRELDVMAQARVRCLSCTVQSLTQTCPSLLDVAEYVSWSTLCGLCRALCSAPALNPPLQVPVRALARTTGGRSHLHPGTGPPRGGSVTITQ